MLALCPEYFSSYLGWKFAPERNRTVLTLIFTSNRKNLEGLENVLHAGLGTVSFVGVVMFTVILVIKLRQSLNWRKQATSNLEKTESYTNRDRKIVKMVVLIASILVICYTPGSLIATTTFVIGSGFNMLGTHYNILLIAWSFACMFHGINSSVNFFLYYTMSSNFRKTFREMFLKQ